MSKMNIGFLCSDGQKARGSNDSDRKESTINTVKNLDNPTPTSSVSFDKLDRSSWFQQPSGPKEIILIDPDPSEPTYEIRPIYQEPNHTAIQKQVGQNVYQNIFFDLTESQPPNGINFPQNLGFAFGTMDRDTQSVEDLRCQKSDGQREETPKKKKKKKGFSILESKLWELASIATALQQNRNQDLEEIIDDDTNEEIIENHQLPSSDEETKKNLGHKAEPSWKILSSFQSENKNEAKNQPFPSVPSKINHYDRGHNSNLQKDPSNEVLYFAHNSSHRLSFGLSPSSVLPFPSSPQHSPASSSSISSLSPVSPSLRSPSQPHSPLLTFPLSSSSLASPLSPSSPNSPSSPPRSTAPQIFAPKSSTPSVSPINFQSRSNHSFDHVNHPTENGHYNPQKGLANGSSHKNKGGEPRVNPKKTEQNSIPNKKRKETFSHHEEPRDRKKRETVPENRISHSFSQPTFLPSAVSLPSPTPLSLPKPPRTPSGPLAVSPTFPPTRWISINT